MTKKKMNNGWIKIHRKIMDNCVYKDPHLLHLFIHCLLSANHDDKEFLFGGKLVNVKRGQFITGRFELSKALNMNPSTIYKRLQRLQLLNYISIKSNNKNTLISVVNYSTYQQPLTAKEQQSNNKVTTKEQQSNTNKKDKNIRNKENIVFSILPEKLKGKVSSELWKEWYDYRNEIKKPLTKSSVNKQIKFLLEQSNPSQCIDTAIMNTWQGLFEVKSNGQATYQPERKYTTEEYRNAFGQLAEDVEVSNE